MTAILFWTGCALLVTATGIANGMIPAITLAGFAFIAAALYRANS